MLRFIENGSKSRDTPLRHDLQPMIAAYIEAAGLQQAPKDAPLFRAAKLKWCYCHLDLMLVDGSVGFFGILEKGPN